MPRSSRVTQQRNTQSRRSESRQPVQDEERSVLWFDPRIVPPGMTYGWIRRAVLNQEDAFNIRQRQMQGWKPVPSDRHPEMNPEGWGLVQGAALGYIEVAGLILCECPTVDLERRKRAQDQQTAAALRMPHIEMDKNSRAPTFDDSKVGFERVVTEKRESGDAEFKE